MPRPAPHSTTERIYAFVPEEHRSADEIEATGDFPLLRFVSLVGDQAGEVEDLFDRINYVAPREGGADGDTSDLADPSTGTPAFLAWQGMHVSIDADGMPTAEARAAIAGATGSKPTSLGAMRSAVAATLVGRRQVRIDKHVDGDPWKMRVAVYAGETGVFTYDELAALFPTYDEFAAAFPTYDSLPTTAATIAAAYREKPPGVNLTVDILTGATYDDLAAEFPSYDDLAASFPTYDDMTEHVPGGA